MTITSRIQHSINSKTIVLDGVKMTFSEMLDALKTLDVLAYYQLQLTHKNASGVAKAEGPYEMRLLLPEHLREETGLIVAYYNATNEEMTILQTQRDGNYLVFRASQSISDFVILGDHAVNLVGVCAALTLTLIAQIVAISVILKRRRKAAEATRLSGFMLPTAVLTVRFFPIPVAKAVAVLAILTVILQIVLMCLLVKTDIIPLKRRRRRRSAAPASDVTGVETSVSEAVDAEETSEDAEDAYLPISADEEAAAGVFDEAYEEGAAEAETSEAVSDGASDDGAEEVFAEGSDEEGFFDVEDFIEPAPATRYSLEDDSFFTEEGDEPEEPASAYTMSYDSDTNGYSLEYDNSDESYTDEEFDREGEGFVSYDGEDGYGEGETEGYDASGYDTNGYDTNGYDADGYTDADDYEAAEGYAEDGYAEADGYASYGNGEDYITEGAELPEGELEYGYDAYEDEEFVSDDPSEDVLREDEDYDGLYDGEEEIYAEDEVYENGEA